MMKKFIAKCLMRAVLSVLVRRVKLVPAQFPNQPQMGSWVILGRVPVWVSMN